MMRRGRLGENVDTREELIKKACSLCMKAHKSCSTQKQYLSEKSRSSSEVLFCFGGGSWSVDEWFGPKPFGETKINASLFPSMRSVGNDEVSVVNGAFLKRFEAILTGSTLRSEVERAVTERKQIVFAGHSSGGPIAVLATLWFLENCFKPETYQPSPRCLTFGSPLVGGRMFPHALRRENWCRYFIHFVMKYDIVPRIMLAPLSSIEQILQPFLNFFNPKSTYFDQEYIVRAREASEFYTAVMRSASSLSSHAACVLMGCTNSLLQNVTNFVELSPYRPFGTYIFCTSNGKMAVVENPDAALQVLFFSLQLNSETASAEFIAYKSFKEHLVYESELRENIEMQSVVYLDFLDELPLSSNGAADDETTIILNDLGVSTRGRLCLRAAGELEKQKLRNQEIIDAKKSNIEEGLHMLEKYRGNCEVRRVGYYDAFKLQNTREDFDANVKRLELAGIWDEIIEMLKRYELPDEFEGRKEWTALGTRYRRIVEPLDISNYYRHTKNEDTGPYMIKGRPRRYRYTQRWREHALKLSVGSSSEICFWAELEELCVLTSTTGSFENVQNRVLRLEDEVLKWGFGDQTHKDVLLEESSFVKWWRTLPNNHRAVSCIAGLVNK